MHDLPFSVSETSDEEKVPKNAFFMMNKVMGDP